MTSATLNRTGGARTSAALPAITTPDLSTSDLTRRSGVGPAPARRRVTTRPDGRAAGRRRPAGRAEATLAGGAPSATRCASPVGGRGGPRSIPAVYARRRATAVGVLVGLALAVSVWVIGIVGNNYAESVTPSPAATQVVHVRAGESLSTIAARVAPDMPRQTVIDDIVELNDLESSGLRVGQPLLTPEYR